MNLSLLLAKISSPKKIFFGILILFLTIFLPLHFCSANNWWDKIINGLIWLPLRLPIFFISIIILIIGLFLALGVYLSSLLLSWTAGPNFLGGQFTTGTIVDAGLSVVQPLANVLILIAILVIGIATIMRIESYGMRRLLIPLIVVALLLNFVPTLMGFIVDAANFLIHFFIDPFITAGGFTRGASIIAKFSVWVGESFNNIISVSSLGDPWREFLVQSITPVLGGMMVIIFAFILMLVLIVFCLIFIARYFVLWILTILSPIAVAAYILPFTKTHFDKWKNLFIQWTTIGIVAAFFLWLSIMVMNQAKDLVENQGRIQEEFTSRISTDDLAPSGAALNQTFAQLLNPNNPNSPLFQLLPYFIGLVFMVIAFLTTIATTSMITSAITKGFGQIKGFIASAKGMLKRAGGVGGAIAKAVAPRQYEKARKRGAAWATWAERKMARIPILKESKMREQLAQISQTKNTVEREKKRADSFASPSLAKDILSEAPSPATTAKLLTLIERRDIGEVYEAQEEIEKRKIARQRKKKVEELTQDEQNEAKINARQMVHRILEGSLRIADQAGKLTEIRKKVPHLALVYQTDKERAGRTEGQAQEKALQETVRKIRTSDIKDLDTSSFEGDEGEQLIKAALQIWGKENFLAIAKEKKEIQEKIDDYAKKHLYQIGRQLRAQESIKALRSEGWEFASQLTPEEEGQAPPPRPMPEGAKKIIVPPVIREREEITEQARREREEARQEAIRIREEQRRRAREARERGETPPEDEGPPTPGESI